MSDEKKPRRRAYVQITSLDDENSPVIYDHRDPDGFNSAIGLFRGWLSRSKRRQPGFAVQVVMMTELEYRRIPEP